MVSISQSAPVHHQTWLNTLCTQSLLSVCGAWEKGSRALQLECVPLHTWGGCVCV